MKYEQELDEIKRNVELRIEELIKEFVRYPDKFLTEADAIAYLYHLLLKDFNRLKKTKDRKKSIPLHNEIRWLGESKKLRFRSDIVIFDVSTLRTMDRAQIEIHAKGYSFGDPYVLIEIKLRRNKGGSDNKLRKTIVQDREKIKKIKADISTKFYSYILALDKKRNIRFETENDDHHKEYYVCLEN